MPEPSVSPFIPQNAAYFDLVNQELEFSQQELEKLAANGFVVSDRLVFEQFRRAYAWIYWKDLPVLVTTDSLLHALHQTYDEMAKRVETNLLTTKLVEMLTTTRSYLQGAAHANTDPDFAQFYPDTMDSRLDRIFDDLIFYLSVPWTLLEAGDSHRPRRVQKMIEKMRGENIAKYKYRRRMYAEYEEADVPEEKIGIEKPILFGLIYNVDFTQFQPRGRYADSPELSAYFSAMMWLQLIDFRFVEYDASGQPHVHRDQLVAAHLLYNAIQQAEQRQTWDEIDSLLAAFVGWSDNITLNGFEQFITDAQISSPLDYYDKTDDELLRLLTAKDYGQQRIRGQLQSRLESDHAVPHNISFALMGQRYTVESEVLQAVTYDHLRVNGNLIKRMRPSALDVMAALGNDRAFDHLADELKRYQYRPVLESLRDQISTHSDEFWGNSFYNLWLRAICTLNDLQSGEHTPAALRSSAWADKMLHTQLASWAQLRHDNILYVKEPDSPRAVCEYPAGYVEPYPAFYAALRDYAQFGRAIFERIAVPEPAEPWDDVKDTIKRARYDEQPALRRPYEAYWLPLTLRTYFDRLEAVATTLEQLSLKELCGQPFSEEDELFLRSITVRKYVSDRHYGGWTEEHWDGWYNDLLPFGDKTPALVADIHTNYDQTLGEPGVLHIGTGDAIACVMMVEGKSAESACMFVGPALTYYERFEAGLPPKRLLDDSWQYVLRYRKFSFDRETERESLKRIIGDDAEIEKRLAQEEAKYQERLQLVPPAPTWVSSFMARGEAVQLLALHSAYSQLVEAMSERLRGKIEDILLTCREIARAGLHATPTRILVQFLNEQPESILEVEGVDADMLEELRELLRVQGHLK